MLLHAILVVAMASPPATTSTEPAPAEDHAAIAARAFRNGEFVLAADAFQRAYEQSGDPALLFGRAQALRRAGSCAAAIDVFEEFIATSPPAADAEAAQTVIDECRAILDVHEAPPPEPVAPVDPSTPPPAPAKPKPWHRDVTGGVLVGAGLTLTAIGGALLGSASTQAEEPLGGETEYEQRRDRVRTLSIASVAVMSVGGALLVGALVRYAVVAKRGRSSRVAWHGSTLRF